MKVVIDGVEYVPWEIRPRASMSLADCLKAARYRLGWTLDEAAAEIGVSVNHLSRLEAGRTGDPSLRLAVALSRAYRIDLSYLADTLDFEGDAS